MLVEEPEVEPGTVEPGTELEVGRTVEEVDDPGTELEVAEVVGTVAVVAMVFDVLGIVDDGVIDGVAVEAVDETCGVVVLPKHWADRG